MLQQVNRLVSQYDKTSGKAYANLDNYKERIDFMVGFFINEFYREDFNSDTIFSNKKIIYELK